MGQLVFNFRPVAGGFNKTDRANFLHAYFRAPQQWENTRGAKNFKTRLFFNTSNESYAPVWHLTLYQYSDWNHSP